jgi:hypothetical protein
MFGQPAARRVYRPDPAGMESHNLRSGDYVGPFGNHLQALIVPVDDSSAWAVGPRFLSRKDGPKAISFTNGTSCLVRRRFLARFLTGTSVLVKRWTTGRHSLPSHGNSRRPRPAGGRHWRQWRRPFARSRLKWSALAPPLSLLTEPSTTPLDSKASTAGAVCCWSSDVTNVRSQRRFGRPWLTGRGQPPTELSSAADW